MTPSEHPIRLLVVGQSPVSRERLRALFDSAPDVDVVAEAGTAQKAMRLLEQVEPTAMLVDCDMPEDGSFSLVRDIMTLFRVPIVMITKQSGTEAEAIQLKAREAGAVALVSLAPNGSEVDEKGRDYLVRTVRTMSEVKVVRRRRNRTSADHAPDKSESPTPSPQRRRESEGEDEDDRERSGDVEIVAIGASTGGPQVLQAILRGLAGRLTVPVVIVQHLSQGFQSNLVAWLSESTGAQIRVGEHGMSLAPGIVYLAPDNSHMEVSGSGTLVLTDEPSENGSRPSVSVLFRSVAQHYGASAIGILLTGMGRDGARELRDLRDLGAITIAQNEETSAVHGMPGEAIRLKGARYILPPDRIVSTVERNLPASAGAEREPAPC